MYWGPTCLGKLCRPSSDWRSLVKVSPPLNYVNIFWTHKSKQKPHFSTLMIITANLFYCFGSFFLIFFFTWRIDLCGGACLFFSGSLISIHSQIKGKSIWMKSTITLTFTLYSFKSLVFNLIVQFLSSYCTYCVVLESVCTFWYPFIISSIYLLTGKVHTTCMFIFW